jgi:hypothetical protein
MGVQCEDLALRAACQLPRLQELWVENAGTTDSGVEAIQNLEHLQRLVLNQKDLTARPLRHIARMTDLRDLKIGKIPLRDEHMTFLRRLTKLERLMLPSRNELTEAWLPNLAGMANLDSLYLFDQVITTEGLRHLGYLSKLRVLSLHGTRVTRLEPLRPLTAIGYLCLAYTPVDDSALPVLKDLPRLYDLDLRKTNVTDAGLVTLSGLSALRDLDVSLTKVTDAGLRHLAESKSLRSVTVRSTGVTDAGIAELSKLNPLITVNR